MKENLKYCTETRNMKILYVFNRIFCLGVLKRGVLNSEWFCIGDLPMYIFFIPTHPYMYNIFVGYIGCIARRCQSIKNNSIRDARTQQPGEIVFNTMRYRSSETVQRSRYFQSSVSYINLQIMFK